MVPTLPSDRKFGLFFASLAIVGACYAFVVSANAIGSGLVGLGIVLFILALGFPQTLRVPNKLWFRLGLLLGRIVSPIVLGLIFFGLITPVALVTRLLGRDSLRLKSRNIDSYWIDRNPIGPSPESFKNQF